MTNTLTISRELAERLADFLEDHVFGSAIEVELRVLLAAPAVERQDPVAFIVELTDPNNGHLRRRGLHWHSLETLRDTRDWKEWAGENIAKEQPLYTSPPAPVVVVMSFDFEHPLSKEKRTITLTMRDVLGGMEDYFYDELGKQICQCESVGETNVVDCNCDEYVHDFEIVDACLDKVKEMNK